MLEDKRITKVASPLRNLDDPLSGRRDLKDHDRNGQYEKKRGGAEVACVTGTQLPTDGAGHEQPESHAAAIPITGIHKPTNSPAAPANSSAPMRTHKPAATCNWSRICRDCLAPATFKPPEMRNAGANRTQR